jgi:hypothetical protein
VRDTLAEIKRLEIKLSFRVEEKIIPTNDEIYAHIGESKKIDTQDARNGAVA